MFELDIGKDMATFFSLVPSYIIDTGISLRLGDM